MKPRAAKTVDRLVEWVSGRRRILSIGLTLLSVSVVLIYLSRNIDGFELLGSIRADLLIGMVVALYLALMVAAFRVLGILRKFGLSGLPFLRWLRIYILARFISQVIPQGGNLYRGVALKREAGFPIKRYAAGFVCFTWLDLVLTFLILLVFSLCLVPESASIGSVPLTLVSLAGLALAGAVPLVLFKLSQKLSSGSHRAIQLFKAASGILKEIWNPAFLINFVLTGILYFGLSCAWFYLGFQSIGVWPNPGALVTFTVMMRLSMIASITPGNLGILEIAFGVLASGFGLHFSHGIMLGAIIRGVNLFVVLVLGIVHGGLPLVGQIKRGLW